MRVWTWYFVFGGIDATLIGRCSISDIIHGKLDQRKKHLEIDYTIGRDIKPDDIQKIANTLKEWCESCETMLSAIEHQIDRADSAKTAYVLHNDDVETEASGRTKFGRLIVANYRFNFNFILFFF